jgi:phage shock protein E
MDGGFAWVIGFLAVAALAWVIFRPRAGDAGSVREALGRGAHVLDVRSPAEYAAGHVEGAVNVPVDRLPEVTHDLADKAQPLVVYCRSGARSARARRLLESAGYTDVTDAGPMSRVEAARRG